MLHQNVFSCQVSSMFELSSSVLEECIQFVYHKEELKTLLHYQKVHSHLDHNGKMLLLIFLVAYRQSPKVFFAKK